MAQINVFRLITVDRIGPDLGRHQKQIPFALSRTINAVAYSIQQDTIHRLLPENFILRTDWWRPGRKTGVNYFPSNKKQTPIQATVNTLAKFMELQETGGQKKPRAGEALVPIPTWNAQPDVTQVIRKDRRYRALTGQVRGGDRRTLKQKGSYWVKLKSGIPVIAVRLLDKYRLPLAVMYIGKSVVNVKPRFGFQKNAERITNATVNQIFARELRAAIATAK